MDSDLLMKLDADKRWRLVRDDFYFDNVGDLRSLGLHPETGEPDNRPDEIVKGYMLYVSSGARYLRTSPVQEAWVNEEGLIRIRTQNSFYTLTPLD